MNKIKLMMKRLISDGKYMSLIVSVAIACSFLLMFTVFSFAVQKKMEQEFLTSDSIEYIHTQIKPKIE
ncbi:MULTISPECIES: hypothetical protein [Bacillus]|uniref:hypothetical protein n=1 Tax=Bacillus TaxID=1386 RepID=UPI0004074C42|nr:MULTISPECIES: hypothetical protein [Bacillus]QHZ48140.1 hypothetical protein M654_018470 [Bacillus sp. NSP9.1]WFA04214.1 hypothetical protein P3X63_16490 [Bacillus sp. HSf4]